MLVCFKNSLSVNKTLTRPFWKAVLTKESPVVRSSHLHGHQRRWAGCHGGLGSRKGHTLLSGGLLASSQDYTPHWDLKCTKLHCIYLLTCSVVWITKINVLPTWPHLALTGAWCSRIPERQMWGSLWLLCRDSGACSVLGSLLLHGWFWSQSLFFHSLNQIHQILTRQRKPMWILNRVLLLETSY